MICDMSNDIARLLPGEIEVLASFGLKVPPTMDDIFAHDSVLLLNDEQCLETLNKIMPKLGAPDLKVTASLVIKRIAFLVLAPALYSMTVYSKGLDLSIKNSVFEYHLKDRLWQSGMPIKSFDVSYARYDRDVWRNDVLEKSFSGHLTLLVNQFYHVTKVPKRILWENVAVRVFSIFERRIFPQVTGKAKEMAQQDLAFIVDPDTRHIFALDENPLTRYYRTKRAVSGSDELIRVRRTCCFYYKATEPAEYCSTCPLLLKKSK